MEGKRKDLNADNMSSALKFATTTLNYQSFKWIPINGVDTHSLRPKGANALLLAGYSKIDIQKMGGRKGGNFKEYIREELHCFAEVMSPALKQDFKCVNIAGVVYSKMVDFTRTAVVSDYQPATEEKEK